MFVFSVFKQQTVNTEDSMHPEVTQSQLLNPLTAQRQIMCTAEALQAQQQQKSKQRNNSQLFTGIVCKPDLIQEAQSLLTTTLAEKFTCGMFVLLVAFKH